MKTNETSNQLKCAVQKVGLSTREQAIAWWNMLLTTPQRELMTKVVEISIEPH